MKSYIDRLSFILIIIIISLFIVVGTITYSLFKPFAPIGNLDSYNVATDTLCPSELLALKADVYIEPGSYHMEIDPLWYNETTGDIWDTAQADYYFTRTQADNRDDKDTSNLVYEAPPEPGEWTLLLDGTLTGRVGVLPRTQAFTTPPKKVNVADCGDSYKYKEVT